MLVNNIFISPEWFSIMVSMISATCSGDGCSIHGATGNFAFRLEDGTVYCDDKDWQIEYANDKKAFDNDYEN